MRNSSQRMIHSTSKRQVIDFLLQLKSGPGCSKQPLKYHCSSKHRRGSC